MKFLWGITALASTLSAFILLSVLFANNAIWIAALAASAAAVSIVPYVFTRAAESFEAPAKEERVYCISVRRTVEMKSDAWKAVRRRTPVLLVRDSAGTIPYVLTVNGKIGDVLPTSIRAAEFALLASNPADGEFESAAPDWFSIRVRY